MANFELRAKAKREIECDLMNINVTFHANANSSSDCSKKVMDECERFLEEIKKYGVPIDEIRIESDNVVEDRYNNDYSIKAKRSIIISNRFDMVFLNYIKKVLQDGKYEYDFDVDFDISNEHQIRIELGREALAKSRIEAEKLADSLGMKVKGVSCLEEPGWREASMERKMLREYAMFDGAGAAYGSSNSLKADTKVIDVDYFVKWEIE